MLHFTQYFVISPIHRIISAPSGPVQGLGAVPEK